MAISFFEKFSKLILTERVKQWRHGINRFLAKFSQIPNDAVLDPDTMPWTAEIAAHTDDIKAELQTLMRTEIQLPSMGAMSPDHGNLDPDHKWRSFFMYAYGESFPRNIAKAPKTSALVARVPGLLTAMFSIHQPGAVLRRHRGATKGFITCHLGLEIPSENVFIQVNDQRYTWEEGRWFIFDDTQWHKVRNDSDQIRAILLLHVKRPMRGVGALMRDFILWFLKRSHFVQEGKRNLEKMYDATD